jgi:hypothetical protein
MLSKTFEYRQDFNGILGFIPVNAPTLFDAGDGRLVAHDILEHFSNTTCSWEDELLALGAMIHVRANDGYFTSNTYNPDWTTHLANDLLQVFSFVSTTRLLHDVAVRDVNHVGDDIDSAITKAYKNMLLERSYDEDNYDIEVITQQLPLIKKWVIKGYNKAVKRYSKCDYPIVNLFYKIENELQKNWYKEENTKITVSVNLLKATVIITHKHY